MDLSKYLLLLLFISLSSDFIFSLNNNPEVSTELGRVKGSIIHTRLGKKVFAFRGVYYAEPPIGNLRFKSPVPKKPWMDVMDATEEGPSCPQEKGILQSENCLTMSIYTKAIKTSAKKSPVIVYIHGGGLHSLSSQSFLFGPYYLLDEDVVLVSINYRLGSLGFLNTGDEFAPGNFGLKDQVEALRFIQKHIHSFGGDPNSVTLTGESGGSRSVVLHLVSPTSKGLFHRAIGMSGAPVIPQSQTQQLDVAVRQAELLGCQTNSKEEMYRCLMEKPAEDYAATDGVMSTLWQSCPALTWYPAIEKEIPGIERFLSDDPVKLMQKGLVNPVPIILGVTKDEFSNSVTDIITDALNGNDSQLQELNNRWYALAPLCFLYEKNSTHSKFISDQISRFYFNHKRISLQNYDKLRQLFGTSLGHFPYYRAAKLLAEFGPQSVYFYKFTYFSEKMKNEWKKLKGEVAHADDLQFLFLMKNDVYTYFNEFPAYNENDPEIIMVKRWTKLWSHFANTGEPLPRDPELFENITWEPLTPQTKKYLNIGIDLKLETDFMGDIMEFWDKLFPLGPE